MIGGPHVRCTLAGNSAKGAGRCGTTASLSYTHRAMPDDISQLNADLRAFVRARDWERFHTPKNLVMALSVEVAELMEHFQWLSAEQSDDLDAAAKAAVADELADVQIYLLQLANRLDVDVLDAVRTKMVKNAVKYPESEG